MALDLAPDPTRRGTDNHMDPRTGRWGATNLAEYLVPVNADAPDVTVEFVEARDDLVGPLGAKGVGEIGQVGTAATRREGQEVVVA